jgi:hypothetical protein
MGNPYSWVRRVRGGSVKGMKCKSFFKHGSKSSRIIINMQNINKQTIFSIRK